MCYAGVTVSLHVHPDTDQSARVEAQVGHAVLYVFDSEGAFLERRETEIGKTELLWHPDAGELTVVGWLNKTGDHYNVNPLSNKGGRRTEGLVSLSQATRSEASHRLPTDLFYGDGKLQNISGTTTAEVEHLTLHTRRMTGMMNITVRSLQEYAGYYDENYWIVVGPASSAVDFFGQYASCEARHIPSAKFGGTDREYHAENFNLLPTGAEPLSVQIWYAGTKAQLVYETNLDSAGKPIEIVANRTENVLIDFTNHVYVEVQRSRWDTKHSWKTFN